MNTTSPTVDVQPALARAVERSATRAPRRTPSQRWRRWIARGGAWALVLGAPSIIIFLYFAWGPTVRGLVLSLQKTNFLTTEWVGWSNFSFVLSDPVLPTAIWNTLAFTALSLLVGAPLPLFLAVFMSELRRTRGVYSALAYLPVVIPPVVSILLWKVMFDPTASGPLNAVLALVGLGPYAWLSSQSLVIPSMVIELTWAGAGTSVIIYLAALAGVRSELYEASELDGAGVLRRVWHITLPQIRPIILVLILLHLIGIMQVFNEPKIFTGGGPNNASLTILLLIYQYGFVNMNFGAAAALSVLLAGALVLVSVAYQLLTRRIGQSD